jgi:hypothetical protein
MIKFFAGSCLSGLGIVLKEPFFDLMLKLKFPENAGIFIYCLGKFFHYEPLSMSSFSKKFNHT